MLLPGHDVPLGRYTTVRRLLPQRGRRMVGAWCFVDHFGPEDIADRPACASHRTRTPVCKPSPGWWPESWTAATDRFGPVRGCPEPLFPAPELPTVRLKPRGRTG